MHQSWSLRETALGLLLGMVLCATGSGRMAQAEEPKTAPGAGKAELSPALRRHLGKQATVVVFLGVGCPVANAYLPHLNDLARNYEPRGVRLVGVNANDQDSAADVAQHAREYGLAFPVLKDDGQKWADALGAERVPEAVVLDARELVRYRGRIDDRVGVAGRKERPTRNDLAAALDEVLAGKPVSVPRTEVSGCLIGRSQPGETQPITYSNQGARILQKRCQTCHRPEGVAPFALTSYEQAKAWAATIKEVVAERRMPPWHADPRHGKFANDRSLTQGEIDTLVAWADGGRARGQEKDLPAPPVFPKGKWTIGEPDLQFPIPREFTVPARGVLPYQDFVVETGFKEDRWVERAQVVPGSKAVHHVVVFIQGAGDGWLCTYVPGDSPLVLPPGMAKKVPAGAKLRFNLHYTTTGKEEHDRTTLGLIFAKQPPPQEVHHFLLDKRDIKIPAGAADHLEEKDHPVPQAVRVLSLFPHMHVRGKSWECQALYPDGRTETVLRVPRYDFNWQHTYRLAEPLLLPAGTRLRCVAHYDNSKANPANPDPDKAVRWGPQSWDEMMAFGVEYLKEARTATPGPEKQGGAAPLPPALLGPAAKRLNEEAGKLDGLPFRADGDVAKAAGLRQGQRVALVIPAPHLAAEAVSGAGREVVPVGQLWLREWAPAVGGKALAPEQQRVVTVAVGNQQHRLAIYLLGVKKNGAGAAELVLYAQGREPLLTVPLQTADARQTAPLELDAQQSGTSAALTLRLVGKFQATLALTPDK